MEPSIELDAREFGVHVRQGEWRLGLLVARNVEPGTRPPVTIVTGVKVSATEFAKKANTSVPRVMRYLEAWDKAAEAGHVPSSSELTPGDEVDLNVEKLPPWHMYYTSVKQSPQQTTTTARTRPTSELLDLPGVACGYSTAKEQLDSIEVNIGFIFGPRYKLTPASLDRLENILTAALEEVRNYHAKDEWREERREALRDLD
jgi:hypothetical protein